MSVRDPQQNPMKGDVLQVIPPFDAPIPAPMVVLEVTTDRVVWSRSGREFSTQMHIWKSRIPTGGGLRRIVFADSEKGAEA